MISAALTRGLSGRGSSTKGVWPVPLLRARGPILVGQLKPLCRYLPENDDADRIALRILGPPSRCGPPPRCVPLLPSSRYPEIRDKLFPSSLIL